MDNGALCNVWLDLAVVGKRTKSYVGFSPFKMNLFCFLILENSALIVFLKVGNPTPICLPCTL